MLIAQYKGTSWMSRTIQFCTRSPYSHSAFIFDAGAEDAAMRLGSRLWKIDRTYVGAVIEAWGSGVRNTGSPNTGHNPGTVIDSFEFVDPLTAADEERLLLWLDQEIGLKYDRMGVLRFVTKRPGCKDDAWFCSELIFQGAAEIGLHLLERTESWEVAPDLIARSPLLRFKETLITG